MAVVAAVAVASVGGAPAPAVDTASRIDGWADDARCIDCHVQAREFPQTGHANTLRRADDEQSRGLLRQFSGRRADLAESLQIEVEERGIRALDLSAGTPRSLPLDWCFGSGTHACTWVGTLPDSWGATDMIEFRWTWYADRQNFDRTPGQPAEHGTGYFGRLGLLFDPPKTRRCFGCHATRLPTAAGAIDEVRIQPGVTCQRCHGPLGRHVASEGGHPPESLRTLSQTESVARCAQCHRGAEDRDPREITPDNREIVRFQPIGLVQSDCYRRSSELTCVTCHDPHRPFQSQDSRGIWQCVKCHDPARAKSVLCAAGRRDDCLTCHMPKVRGEAPVDFTDHWIRVRHDSETPQ